MEVKVKKLLEDTSSNICYISEDIFNNLNLAVDVEYNIHVGQLNQYSYIRPNKDKNNSILIPSFMFDKLLMLENLTLNIKGEDRDIYLGPVVGIFINHYNFPLYENGSAPKYHGKASLVEHCLCYYFSIDDIDWDEKKIRGYTLSPVSNEWVRGWFPMLEVLYDRGVGFEVEEKPIVKEIRKNFKNYPNVHIINRRNYLGKWETYQKLSVYPEVCKFLPKTIKYTNFNDVIIMLKQKDFIFIKGSYGSRGRQVLSIEKLKDKYRLVFYSRGLNELILDNLEQVRSYVEDYVDDDKQFIIQDGIRLLKYNGQVFDMRLLTIKDKQGKWRVIRNWARIAKSNFTITNYCAGGGLDFYEKIYPKLSSPLCKGKIPDNNEIIKSTIKIAEYIEKAFGNFGEIGMDMAIDVYGKLWFIEANTKPDKNLVEGYNNLKEIPLQNLAIFEYARYLTKF